MFFSKNRALKITCVISLLMITFVYHRYISAENNTHQIKFGATYMTMNNTFYKAVNNEIENVINDHGDILYTRDPALDAKKQEEQINDLIDLGIDVLIVNPVESSTINKTLKKVKKAGIKIIVVDAPISDDQIADCTVVSDNYDAGVKCALDMMQRFEKARIVLLEHQNVLSAVDRINGFKDTVSTNENYQIVGSADCLGQTEIALPEELTMDTYETYGVDNEIKVEQNDDGTVKLTINKLNKNSELNILLICNTKSIDKETVNKDIKVSAITKVGREEYNSNTLIKTINQSETGLSMEINKNFTADETFKENKNLEYSVYLKNNGSLDLNTLKVITQLDKGLTIKELYINGAKTEVSDGSNLETYLKLASKKEITVKYILGLDINEADKEKELEINTSIDSGYTEQLTSKTIVKINKNAEETPDNPDNPDNPGTPDNPDNPNPTPEDKKFKIEGTAWLDSDKDGKRDEGETLLKDIKVTLINKETGETVKDESGNARTATTDENGKYSFDNLSKGTYLVVFEFDSNKYTVTTYQKEGIENSLNSDATMSNIKIDGNSKLVGVTDYIKLEDADASNIDLGLIENAVFDLSLNKLIDSITVVTVQGNKTTNYKNKNFAKVDLVARYMNDTDVIIKYKFVIKNEGDVTAYVDRLEDNLPSGLEFSSELNKDWYKGSDGNLYTTSLAGIAIEPGKTSETELVLTKKTTEETTGTFKNNAELSKISNLEAIEEKEEAKANNKSSADVVISIKTGSAIMYIGITLGSMAIIAAGAYIIKKKVINKGI